MTLHEVLLFDERDAEKDPNGEWPPESSLGFFDTLDEARSAVQTYMKRCPREWEHVTHAIIIPAE